MHCIGMMKYLFTSGATKISKETPTWNSHLARKCDNLQSRLADFPLNEHSKDRLSHFSHCLKNAEEQQLNFLASESLSCQ